MNGYSLDLRERVINQWQAGKTQTWIASTFAISLSSVKRYIARYKQTGKVAATHQSYQQPLLPDSQLPLLVEQLKAHPRAKIAEHCDWWATAQGVVLSESMMWRAIARAGWTYKKKQWQPKNAIP